MEEKERALRVSVAGAVDEAGHRFGGVDRVEDEALCAGGEGDGFGGGFAELPVAGGEEIVGEADIVFADNGLDFQKVSNPGALGSDPFGLCGGVSANADAGAADRAFEGAESEEQPGVGGATSRGNNDLVDGDLLLF